MTPTIATLIEAAQAIRVGARTPTELAEHALEQIETKRDLNSIAFVDGQRALREADVLTREAKSGQFRGPLHGVPITVKDLFNVHGMPTKAGTRATLPVIKPDEAVAVQRLRAAGAMILAKTNMVEVALGLHGENAWTGDVKNPHDPARQTGGSSSGSAAAVAAGIGFGSLGSDTAGSIRVPAAFCGIVGFKPSFGAVSLAGALALCPSCDHAGPLARTVTDAQVLYAVLSAQGRASNNEVRSRAPMLAVPRAYIDGATTREMRLAFDACVQRARERGATIREATFTLEDFAAIFAPMRAESAHIHRHALETHPEAFQPGVREALMQGFQISALAYLDARDNQQVLRQAIEAAIGEADALLLPAAPCAAPLRGTSEIVLEAGPQNQRLAILRFSGPFAFAGVPALSLPCAKTGEGLALGAQLVTRFGEDEQALRLGAWLEDALSI